MMHSPLRFLPSIIHKRPLHLTFFVTRRCNARCPFCFYLNRKDLSFNDLSHKHEVNLEEIKRISSSMGGLLWLAFSGGEVFLRDDIVEISRVFYGKNRPSIMLFPTNGLMPKLIYEKTLEILRDCPKSVVVVKLSMEGLRERHDAFRGTPGGFERVMETYGLLRPLLERHGNFELGVNTVFTSENEDDVGDVISFVRGLEGVRTHTISLVRGDVGDGSLKEVSIEKYLAAARRLEGDVRERTYGFRLARLKAAQDNLQRRLIYKTVKENRGMLPCYAGRLNLVLTETGDVYPCESFRAEHRMGNVRDFGCDMEGLLESEGAKEAILNVQGCFCTHECYMMTNILFNPRMYPRLIREYL